MQCDLEGKNELLFGDWQLCQWMFTECSFRLKRQMIALCR